jgi:chemotaxis signal transduction protein
MSKAVKAWKLDWPGAPLALAQCQVIEVVEEPETYTVPLGPQWCRGLLHWRGQLIPFAYGGNPEVRFVVVVAYQPAPKQPLQFAAFSVASMPQQFDVPADADCEPPSTEALRMDQLRACFEHEGKRWVVPDLEHMFATAEVAA